MKARLSKLNIGHLPANVREVLSSIGELVVFQVPMKVRFRGVTERQGLLLRGSTGWGECAPFWDYGPEESSKWLRSAIQSATSVGPVPGRDRIPVNVTVPVVDLDAVSERILSQPGCSTAKVKVADRGFLDQRDVDRVRFTAELLAAKYRESARVRIDANAVWNETEAAEALEVLNAAAESVGGLEYAEQPCVEVQEMARLRQISNVRIAADESIRRSPNPLAVKDLRAADVAVLKVAPLGGVNAALELGKKIGLPSVVSSALDTSIGLAAGVQLASAIESLDFACGLNTGALLAADVVDSPVLSSTGTSAGYLDVAHSRDVRTGELTSHSDAVPETVVEQWEVRLAQMTKYIDNPDQLAV